MHPKPVPAQGTQSYGRVMASRDVFKEIRMSQKHPTIRKWGMPGTKYRLKKKTREIVVSTPAGKKLGAHASRNTLHGSRPNLYDCVRTAVLCRPA